MNNCPSHVDTNYYSTKYGIANNKKDVIEHYIKKGKQSGHFPNSETEIFYCRMINFDPSYYKRKYSLHHNDNDSLMRHWKFYGHKKGYHVNRCEEIGKHAQFLCNCKIKNNSIHRMTIINDSESYMTESTQSTESESIEFESTESTILSTGIDSVENFNNESVNDDYQFNGRTKKILDSDSESEHGSLDSTVCGTFSETITDETIADSASDEKTKRNQIISSLSSECPSVPNSEDFITSGSESGSGSGSSISKECDCSECQTLIGQKIKNENTFFDAKKTKMNIQRIQINKPSNMENKIMELKIIGLDDRRKKNPIQYDQPQLCKSQSQSQYQQNQQNQPQSQSQPSYQQSQSLPKCIEQINLKQNQNHSEEKEWKKETNVNVSIGTDTCTNNESQTNTSTDDPDNDSFGEYMDDSYQKVSSMSNGIRLDRGQNLDKETTLAKDSLVKETMIEDTMIKDTMIEETMIGETMQEDQCNYVKSYYPTLEIGLNTVDTETSFREKIARDEARLCKIQDKIKNYAMINPEPYNIVSEKAIFDNHMENVCQNITNIKNYLHMCQIHLDTYIIIFKQAYQCITNICNVGNNYMGYNAARIKLSNMLKEAENISNSSYYNDLPIFFTNRSIKSNGIKGNGSTKSPSFIKFPLLISMSDNVNDILAKTIGDDHVYFKVRLMRVSVRCLKLEKYCFPALNRGDKITAHTSPIPPCDCPVGKIPDRNMYTDQNLIKCWDICYHLKVFENAMYKITMTNEILNNYHKLIEIKEELCYKIKLANLKN
jgi:hypothetical protein